MNHVIIFLDVVGSVEHKNHVGSAVANVDIAHRLAAIVNELRAVDPTIIVPGPSEGDSILATGSDLLKLFTTLVCRQHAWKCWRDNTLPVRISIGFGEYQVMEDGAMRGMEIDRTHRILSHCEPGGIVVTESVRPVVFDAGMRYKLLRKEADLKGFGREIFWKTNGTFLVMDRRANHDSIMWWIRSRMQLVIFGLACAATSAVLSAAFSRLLQ